MSSEEQDREMTKHLEAVHPYWQMENLGEVGASRHQFKEVGFDIVPPSPTTTEPQVLDFDRKRLFGIAGSILLFIGVFTPIISLPFVGGVNYFRNGTGDGVIVLFLACISFLLSLTNRFRGLWFTGGASLAVMLFTFVNFQTKLAETKSQMETQLAGNPFRGLADVAMQSVQLQWGWAVLVVGAGLVITSAALQPKTKGLEVSDRINAPNPSLQPPSAHLAEPSRVNETRNVVLIAMGTVLLIGLMIIVAYYGSS